MPPEAFTSQGAPAGASPIRFPPELPISARAAAIAEAVQAHQVVIVAGATGSGKTTQLPKIALALGRGVERLIGVTQPRRIAATSVAARVASELGTALGAEVGYQIRFEDRTSPGTYVKFMTDGILLAEIQGDPRLSRYDTLILDEAHERSLNIDFLLGWVKRILPERPDLKIIVSSATLDTERFADFFGGAPIVQVEGRTFPVEVLYEPPDDDALLPEAVARAVQTVTSLDPRGDILVFLPGEREIRETEDELRALALRHTVVQPLYARLTAAEQARVFSTISQRRIILATNVAETSLTIPGIVYVIDPGLARLSRYDARSGTTRLHVEAISRASADQRKGRCGRVRDGICVRLYDEESFAARPAFTDPEIKRTGLAGVILRMKALGLGDVEDFPFLEPPQSKAITEGYRVLEELGALDAWRELTPLGRDLARFPVDPRVARMIMAGAALSTLREVLVIAAALTIQDPRERPRDAQEKADALHRRFRDERSDFVALLRVWKFVDDAARRGSGTLRRACRENFLSFVRVREWREIHRQLEDVVRELDVREARPRAASRDESVDDGAGAHDALHCALLQGLLSKVGAYHSEQRVYLGARQTRFVIHPSSALAKKPPAWLMAFELVETTQLFARTVAKIEPEWLLSAAPHLLKKNYSEPHWSDKSARAQIREHATLFGLTVAKDRSVSYATVAPAAARRMFVEHALVRGEFTSRGAFFEHNRALLAEVARLRDKARRSDMLADDDALFAFFDKRVPAEVVDGKSFEVWRERAEKDDPKVLRLTIDDVLVGDQELKPADYPDAVTVLGLKLALIYHFDPSADDDGVTITVPLVALPQLAPSALDWTIPGWHEEKIYALLGTLPRATRRELGEFGEQRALARDLAATLTPFDGPMKPALTRALAELTGVLVREDELRTDEVPPHLRLTCRVVDEAGRVVAQGRDVDAILEAHGARARAAWKEAAPPAFGKTGLTAWTGFDLPPFVVRRVAGHDVRSYPALVDRGPSVDLVLLESAQAAEEASRAGVRRLVMLVARRLLSGVSPRLPGAFAHLGGAFASRAENEAFREALLLRIVELAFGLGEGAPLPRDQGAFDRLVQAGAPRIDGAVRAFVPAVQAAATELDKTLAMLRTMGKHPSGRTACADVQAQLEHLFPADLIAKIPLVRLEHYPRYLRAAQARVGRAVNDPRKDMDKAAPLVPLWSAFLGRRSAFRDVAAAEELRWAFEELRVATFAPELRPAIAVSVAKVGAALAALR
jgi:ATP-dependent helicase HrpA